MAFKKTLPDDKIQLMAIQEHLADGDSEPLQLNDMTTTLLECVARQLKFEPVEQDFVPDASHLLAIVTKDNGFVLLSPYFDSTHSTYLLLAFVPDFNHQSPGPDMPEPW